MPALEIIALLHGIAASFRGICCAFYLNEFTAKAHYFFLYGRACIEHLYHRTQPAACGNGLEARNTRTEYQHFCRRNTTRRGHEHREIAAVFICRKQHRFIARNIGLRAKHVHCLGTRGTWYGIHAEDRIPLTSPLLHEMRTEQWLENTHYHCACFYLTYIARLHGQYHIG